jgi:hypothetical protein
MEIESNVIPSVLSVRSTPAGRLATNLNSLHPFVNLDCRLEFQATVNSNTLELWIAHWRNAISMPLHMNQTTKRLARRFRGIDTFALIDATGNQRINLYTSQLVEPEDEKTE